MTLEEKGYKVEQYCREHTCSMDDCEIYKTGHPFCFNFTAPRNDTEVGIVESYYSLLFGGDKESTPTADAVNHPDHYNREGAMECIEEMILAFGLDAVIAFCKCNVWKYRYRAGAKNGDEDLKKADRYMLILQDLEGRR